MPTLWTQQQWNAGWACRRCLIHIWNVAPGTFDRILEQYSSKVYPTTPTKRTATAEVQEDSYDISVHLSPTGVDAAAKDTYSRQSAPRDELTPNDREHGRAAGESHAPVKVGRDSSSVFPDVGPPQCPVLPTQSTLRLDGVEADGPVHSLVKYLLEWNHSVDKCWADFAPRCGGGIPGDRADEGSWPTASLLPVLVMIYGESIPNNGHPPRHPLGWATGCSGQSGIPPNEIQREVPRHAGQ